MTTKLRLSHIHLRVRGIKRAVADFEQAGFRVEWGRNPQRSPNAFIWFNDVVFIELFTMLPPTALASPFLSRRYGPEMRARWDFWRGKTEGLLDFAVEAEDPDMARIERFETVRSQIEADGIRLSRSWYGSRVNPRGERVEYAFSGLMPVELPFLVSTFNIPQIPDHIDHPNGIHHIRHLYVTCTPELMDPMQRLICGDPKIILEPGERTAIRAIAFAGGDAPLPAGLLHGMVVADR